MSARLPADEKARRKEARTRDRMEQIRELLMTRRRVTASGCWEWTGVIDHAGYGRVKLNSRRVLVHRLAAHFFHGLDLADRWAIVRHHCDNPPCFNPDHIAPGTVKENWQDAVDRGRITSVTLPKDECRNGHPIVGENLKLQSTGWKTCRICNVEWQRRDRERRRLRGEVRKNRPSPPVVCVDCDRRVLERNLAKHLASLRHQSNASGRLYA